MIATLLLLCAQAPPQLTPELLVAHPGFVDGRYSEVREDQLQALEADPESPFAYAATQAIYALEDYCAEPLAPERLAKLAERVTDARAQRAVKELLEAEIDRRRFSDAPVPPAHDLYSDFFDNWFALGPYGRGDEPYALLGDADPNAPHHVLREEYASIEGATLRWKPLTRSRNIISVATDDEFYPSEGGTAYLLASVEADVEEALLEIEGSNAVQVYWNGALIHEELRAGLTQSDSRMTVPVRLAAGPNRLMLRFQHGEGARFGARLLQLDDRVLNAKVSTSKSLEVALRPCPTTDCSSVKAIASELPKQPFSNCVEMLTATSNRRADRALAIPEPESSAELPAWLRLRHMALRASGHLPTEVDRRFHLDVEERLTTMGLNFPEIELQRAIRFMDEDQLESALEITEQLVASYPRVPLFHWVHHGALTELDNSGVLGRKALYETLSLFDDAVSWDALADVAMERNDVSAAIEMLTRAAAADGGHAGYAGRLLSYLAEGTEEQIARAERMIEHWRPYEPYSDWFDDWLLSIHTQRNNFEAVEAQYVKQAKEEPHLPKHWRTLASFYLRHGREADARGALERTLSISADDEWARRALMQLGDTDESEQFFREFAADREAALAAMPTASGASTALVLDSRMVFVREDGSAHSRTHSITLAIDRTGTEQLQEQAEQGETLVAQVLGADGRSFEPILVDGSWVMPSLDPGDAIEMVFDGYSGSTRGGTPSINMWAFESLEQPFLISRFVTYLPDGVPGSWALDSFTGEHQEIPWKNGTVHVFEMRDRPRLEPETAMPSRREVLSWVEYGADIETRFVAQEERAGIAWQQDVADDVAVELRAFVADLSARHSREELPRAIYDAVTEHVIEFGADGDTTDVWYLKRGHPTGLIAALFEIADIEYEWAVPFPEMPAKLNPDPLRPFLHWGDRGRAGMRIPNSDGSVTWLFIPPGGRGLTYGRLPGGAGGTRVLVLEGDGYRFETLPDPGDDTWMQDLEVDIHLQDDKSARVSLRYVVADLGGPLTREAVSQAEPQQREQFARNTAKQLVTGLDVTSWEVKDMRVRGADLELVVEGTIKRFVKGTSRSPYCKLPWTQHRLSRITGEGDRLWPFAYRTYGAIRYVVRLHGSEAWSFEAPPETKEVNRDGFHYEIRFEQEADMLTATKVFNVHGLMLSAEELAAFGREVKDLEDLDTTRLTLTAKK